MWVPRGTVSHPSLATALIRGMIMASEHRLEHPAAAGDFLMCRAGPRAWDFSTGTSGHQVANAAYCHTVDLLGKAGSLKPLIQTAA